MLDYQFDSRDTAIIGLQIEARQPGDDDEFLQDLVEDYEDITIADKRLFRSFLDDSIFESSGLWDAVADLCYHLASADPEDLGGECKPAHKVRAHLMAALKLHAREQARKEVEKDGEPDIYASDFYPYS